MGQKKSGEQHFNYTIDTHRHAYVHATHTHDTQTDTVKLNRNYY